jgi:hypothetical protein
LLERVLGLMERVLVPTGRMSGCMARMSGCMGRMLGLMGKMSGWMRGCQVGWQRFGVESGDGRLDVGLVVKDSGYAGEGVG